MKIDNEVFIKKDFIFNIFKPIEFEEALDLLSIGYGVVILVNNINTIINIMFIPDGYVDECEDVINDYCDYVESITGLVIE